jgi:hypothetical protein
LIAALTIARTDLMEVYEDGEVTDTAGDRIGNV